MLPTPSTSHVPYDRVYEPAEDSFLLLDTLSGPTESAWLKARFAKHHATLAVEVGTGSGVVIAFLAANAKHILGRPLLTLGVDVNFDACLATARTASMAISDQQSESHYLGSLCSDLDSVLVPGSVDILVFNPPYVPSEQLPELPHLHPTRDAFERDSHLLSLSYAGGLDGMETTNRLLAQIPSLLRQNGVAYILLCAQNHPEEVKLNVQALPNGPWHVETVGSSGKVAGWEKLSIIRIWK